VTYSINVVFLAITKAASPLLAHFGRDRRIGECLLLREERKSGLQGPDFRF
jgi:hypothetical protein